MVWVMAVARWVRLSKDELDASRLTVEVEVSVSSNLVEYDNIAKMAGGVRLCMGSLMAFIYFTRVEFMAAIFSK